jgi:flagellin
MLSLHTNNAALAAQTSIGKTQSTLSTSMTRLSTGYRINSASDDAAGLQIATRLKAQSSGMAVAMRNTQNATSMMQTAEGALGETSNILVRMKDLATQGADASATDADKTAMQSEYDALSRELSNIVGNTSFGGAKLLMQKASDSALTKAANEKAIATNAVGAPTDPADPTTATGATKAYADAKDAYDTAKDEYDNVDTTDSTAVAEKAAALTAANKTMDEAKADLDKKTAALASASAYYDAANASASSTTTGKLDGALNFQIGSSTAETMSLDLSSELTALHTALSATSANYNSFGAALNVTGTELTDPGSASASIDKLQAAIDAVGNVRSSLGAASNRLDHVATNLANISSNTEAAAGRIMDVDFATESSSMTSNQMLLQAGTAMLKQSNSMSSMVMSLLQ